MLVFASYKKGPCTVCHKISITVGIYRHNDKLCHRPNRHTHFCCHFSQAECSTSNNCHIWLVPLGQNSCKQQLLVCLSFTSCHIWLLHLGQNSCKQQLLACLSLLAISGYYILTKTAASNNCWLAFHLFPYLVTKTLSKQLQATTVGLPVFHLLPYLVTTSWSKTAASINCWLFLYFFQICHNWLHHSQSSSKQQTGFAFILSYLPYLVTS